MHVQHECTAWLLGGARVCGYGRACRGCVCVGEGLTLCQEWLPTYLSSAERLCVISDSTG